MTTLTIDSMLLIFSYWGVTIWGQFPVRHVCVAWAVLCVPLLGVAVALRAWFWVADDGVMLTGFAITWLAWWRWCYRNRR